MARLTEPLNKKITSFDAKLRVFIYTTFCLAASQREAIDTGEYSTWKLRLEYTLNLKRIIRLCVLQESPVELGKHSRIPNFEK